MLNSHTHIFINDERLHPVANFAIDWIDERVADCRIAVCFPEGKASFDGIVNGATLEVCEIEAGPPTREHGRLLLTLEDIFGVVKWMDDLVAGSIDQVAMLTTCATFQGTLRFAGDE